MKKALVTLILVWPFFYNQVSASTLSASYCVPDTGNSSLDAITAKAVAKGHLAHELGSQVSATTNLETVTVETETGVNQSDTLTESVTLKSEHKMTGVKTLESGYKTINGSSQYCVTVGI